MFRPVLSSSGALLNAFKFLTQLTLQLGREIGFKQLRTKGLKALGDLLATLRIGSAENDQGRGPGLDRFGYLVYELVCNAVIGELAHQSASERSCHDEWERTGNGSGYKTDDVSYVL